MGYRPTKTLDIPETKIFAPEKWGLGYICFPSGAKGLFSGAFAVSFREAICVNVNGFKRLRDTPVAIQIRVDYPVASFFWNLFFGPGEMIKI